MDPTPTETGWAARLALEIEPIDGGSRLGRRQHLGPLRIQRAFYPEGPTVPHIYVLHPPGGVVGGDQLEVEIRLHAGANALLTTPAAQKLYRSRGPKSRQRNCLFVAEHAALEWFPAETIAFDGARSSMRSELILAEGAQALAWEILCFGRPASELPFLQGELDMDFEIVRNGCPLLIERTRVDGGSALLGAAWGYRGLPVFGTLYCVPGDPRDLTGLTEALRAELATFVTPAEYLALTALEELLVMRVAATSVERARAVLIAAWQHLRPRVLGRTAITPRIWNV